MTCGVSFRPARRLALYPRVAYRASRVGGSRGQSVRSRRVGTNSWVFARWGVGGWAGRCHGRGRAPPRPPCGPHARPAARSSWTSPRRRLRARASVRSRRSPGVFPRSSVQVRNGPTNVRDDSSPRCHDCARRDAGRVTRGSASARVIPHVSGRRRPSVTATSRLARSFRHAPPPASAPARALGFRRYASGESRCRGKRAPGHARARAVVASARARGGPGSRAHPETPHRRRTPYVRAWTREAESG